MRVVRDLECTRTSSLLSLRVVVMRGAVKFLFVFVTRGDTSTMMRDANAYTCTQDDGATVGNIVSRPSIAAVLRFFNR